jgi:hypothetical protein
MYSPFVRFAILVDVVALDQVQDPVARVQVQAVRDRAEDMVDECL